jgi:hypothetical protein
MVFFRHTDRVRFFYVEGLAPLSPPCKLSFTPSSSSSMPCDDYLGSHRTGAGAPQVGALRAAGNSSPRPFSGQRARLVTSRSLQSCLMMPRGENAAPAIGCLRKDNFGALAMVKANLSCSLSLVQSLSSLPSSASSTAPRPCSPCSRLCSLSCPLPCPMLCPQPRRRPSP